MNTKKQIFTALIFLVFIVGLSFITNADDGITVDVKVVSPCDPTAQNTGCPGAIYGHTDENEVITKWDYYKNTLNVKHIDEYEQAIYQNETSGCFCLSCKPAFDWFPEFQTCDYETQTCRVEDYNEGVWTYDEGACRSNQEPELYTDFMFTPNWYSNNWCIFPSSNHKETCCLAIESDGKKFFTGKEIIAYY